MTLTVAELAAKLGAPCEGDVSAVIRRAAALRDAAPGDVTFLSSARYATQAASTQASALVVKTDWKGSCGAPALIRVPNPDAAFIRIAGLFAPPAPPLPPPGIHPTAVVAPDAELGPGVSIGPHAVVESGARLGEGTMVGAGAYIGHGVVLGRHCRLYPHVSLREHVRLGDRVIVHNGAVIGSDGFGYYPDAEKHWQKIPQVGVVVIGNDVEIGANTTIDRARFGETRIEDGCKIDNLVQVGHNVVIGAHTAVAGQAGFAGSAIVGRHCMVGGQAGCAGHLEVGDGAIIGAQSGVIGDVPPGAFVAGMPALPHATQMRQQALLGRLPKLREAVAALEARLKALEERGKS
ncbi:MAG: UDP-3-O-(3-hydroxymyristoyl)glucosamine N-acyltransferase [Kiritimatiellia bacterium]